MNLKKAPGAHWSTFGRGKPKIRGQMNKTEIDYAADLALRQRAGDVLWFVYEGLTFRLAAGCHYTPDFVIMLADGTIECHEVKGFWTTSARVRIKVAAELYPFRFIAVSRVKRGTWKVEEF